MTLLLELHADDVWRTIGRVEPGHGGSMSNRAGGRREILKFDSGLPRSTVDRSIGGADVEHPVDERTREYDWQTTTREILTVGFERLADLGPGETYELDLQTDRMAAPQPFRFRQT